MASLQTAASGAADATAQSVPAIRKITPRDLWAALQEGFDDFRAMPSHVVFLGLIYPIVGLLLGRLVFGYDVLPLLFPLMAGFALIGPFAAIGLYELSRRREEGLDTSWKHAFDVFRSPSFGSIAALGVLLLIIFFVWIAVANAIYVATFGYAPAASIPDFIDDVVTTPAGWTLIIRRQRGRLPLRGPGADDQRRLLPAASRSPCQSGRCHAHLGSCRHCQSVLDGTVGPHRRGSPRARLDSAILWPRAGGPDPWTRDLAPLQAGRRGLIADNRGVMISS